MKIISNQCSVVFLELLEQPKNKGKGRPRKYGDKVTLSELFKDERVIFNKVAMKLYGKLETV